MKLLIIDGQGGKIGRTLIEEILKSNHSSIEITAVGTNSIATAGMIKAGAHHAATGENAVCVAAKSADVIVGPIGIVLADALLGEVTPRMAAAIAQSRAKRILIPFQGCNTTVIGTQTLSMSALIEKTAMAILKDADKT